MINIQYEEISFFCLVMKIALIERAKALMEHFYYNSDNLFCLSRKKMFILPLGFSHLISLDMFIFGLYHQPSMYNTSMYR